MYALLVTIYYTSYKLIFTYELLVTIYCTCCIFNVDCVKLFSTISAIHFYDLFFTKSSIPSQLFLSNLFHEWVLQRQIIISYFFMWKISLHFHDLQKKPSIGILRKRCSENMQQIYRRTPMLKRDFNKVAKSLQNQVFTKSSIPN